MKSLVFTFFVLAIVACPVRAQDSAGDVQTSSAALKQLQGDWRMEFMERGGKRVDDALVKTFSRTVTGRQHTVRWREAGADQILHTTLTLDPAQNPKAVDLLLADGPFKGKTRLGIYKLEGDTETVCLAQPDKPRPTAFDSKQGALHIWKRVKKQTQTKSALER